MPTDVRKTGLMRFLEEHEPVYYGRVLELAKDISGWLAYIPQTFPHYTRHTVEHSEEIIAQISKLLFADSDEPVIDLSSSEAYILIASAYLHDAGMVASDSEKQQILSSDDWRVWVEEGAGAERWREAEALRANNDIDTATRLFLADVQTRFLLAEFIRRSHHTRARDVIVGHQASLGSFAFDDPILLRTISDVCASHGLKHHELEDRDRFPDVRDIRDEPVNVRLTAILLRLGDLLDISSDRACPLLLNAASPLPADSFAHWSQYQRITHRVTSPDRIEITAECAAQSEHRLLQDWCQWIVDELKEARTLVAKAHRHAKWVPPQASLDGENPTINIRPKPDATYFFSDWTFKLDEDEVYQRFVYDLYDSPTAYLRELIQNALDANRCRMFDDLRRDGLEAPEYPTAVDKEYRERYPVKVTLDERRSLNELSGEEERKQILTVEDCGIGMDQDIVARYFLQIGRSYYVTPEFQRSYGFVPTSRFGVGFLSVFAVSDKVIVETYKPGSLTHARPIRLTLTGPRNYLLTEKGERESCGTRIDVELRERLSPGELTAAVASLCRRVEFPVVVNDLEGSQTIRSERPEEFVQDVPDLSSPGGRLVVKAFPIARAGIEGELYLFARITREHGEDWTRHRWAAQEYPLAHASAIVPKMPMSMVCMHGISLQEDLSSSVFLEDSGPTAERLDLRGAQYTADVSRTSISRRARLAGRGWRGENAVRQQVGAIWEELLRDHLSSAPLAGGDDGWIYRERLASIYPGPFWDDIPTIRVTSAGATKVVALNEIRQCGLIHTTLGRVDNLESLDSDELVISDADLARLSQRHLRGLFDRRAAVSLEANASYLMGWAISGRPVDDLVTGWGPTHRLKFPDSISSLVSLSIHRTTHDVHPAALLNSSHPLIQWIEKFLAACSAGECGLTKTHHSRLSELAISPIWYHGLDLDKFLRYLESLRAFPGLRPDLCPPQLDLDERAFARIDSYTDR